jgi:hypothetical protein
MGFNSPSQRLWVVSGYLESNERQMTRLINSKPDLLQRVIISILELIIKKPLARLLNQQPLGHC